ncbi:hypothetical protein ACHAPO_011549 [Fusarium lateritium]
MPLKTLKDGTSDSDDGDLIGTVTQVGPLTSEIRLSGASKNVQTGWVAKPLTSSNLSNFPFQIDPKLPCYNELLEELRKRSLGKQVLIEEEPEDQAIRVTSRADNEYKVVDRSLDNILYVPSIRRGEKEVKSVCITIEHLARFKMVKSLVNELATDAFRQSVQVRIAVGKETFKPDEQIKARHKKPIEMIVTNTGTRDIYAHFYNLGPCGRVKNIFCGTFMQISPEYEHIDPNEQRCTGVYRKNITMKVPPFLEDRGSCIDIIKTFVTSKDTSFETLELSNFRELEKQESGQRGSERPTEVMEEWMAFNFYVRTSI